MRMRRVAFVGVVAFLCAVPAFFLSAVPAFGQGFATAELNGSVVDQSGGVLPGATVTVTEEATGLVRTAVSDDAGRFVLPAMQPGLYTMKAELAGFQTQTRTGHQARGRARPSRSRSRCPSGRWPIKSR